MPVLHGQKPELSLFKFTVALIAILCLGVTSPFIVAILQNNLTQIEIRRAFNQLEHPAGTELVRAEQRLGVLMGNGNHCDFFYGQLRSYSGAVDELHAYYSNMRLKDFGYVRLTLIETGQISESEKYNLAYGLQSIQDWDISPAELDQNLYIVSVLLFSSGADRDLRCG